MALTALAARRTGRWAVVDVTWGLGFLVVTAIAVVLGDGDVLRRGLLLGLVAAWALRLASHILRRSGGREDPRYEELKQQRQGRLRPPRAAPPGPRDLLRLAADPGRRHLWPRPSAGSPGSASRSGWSGSAFESIGDAQLKEFKADPANHGKVMDRGLWAFTRHPNYFGDACVWWGIYLVAADSGLAGAATILSPVAMTYFLVFATGARLLEKTMMQRDGYPEYAERTSMFFPLPPKKQGTRRG